MTLSVILSFFVTTVISALMIPLVIKAANTLGIVAHKNERTIHKYEIARIGGYAIYLSSLIGAAIFLKTDHQINAILIAGFLVFIVGLYDDAHDLSPKVKVIVELIAALIVVVGGNIYIKGFGYFPSDAVTIFSGFVTILWIVGITNAINLIDGLDGLAAGISIIVLVTISITSLLSGRNDIASLSLVLAGSIMGFLIFNFHPAKIFMGDSGALYIGFMISVISLLGFGYNASAFFTLGAPIIVLMIPIMDTLIAIIRRKIHHKSFSEADKGHLHHNLMFKFRLGQRKSVLVLYLITFLFSLTSYLYYYNPQAGWMLFIFLMFIFEIFVEVTDMISRRYKPVLTLVNVFLHSDDLPKIKFLEDYRKRRTQKQRTKEHIIILTTCALLFFGGAYWLIKNEEVVKPVDREIVVPYVDTASTDLLHTIYSRLDSAYRGDKEDEECQLAAAYFVCDYFTLKNKEDSIGGVDYMYPTLVDGFKVYAKQAFYQSINQYPDLQVTKYNIISYSPSKMKIDDLKYNEYYNVLISIEFNQDVEIDTTVNVTVVRADDRFYICGIDHA